MNAIITSGGMSSAHDVISRVISFSMDGIFVLVESTVSQAPVSQIRWETDAGDAAGIDEIAWGLFEELFGLAHAFSQIDPLSATAFDDLGFRLVRLLVASSPSLLDWILGTNLNSEIHSFLQIERGSDEN